MARFRRDSLPEPLIESKHTRMLQRFSDVVFPLRHVGGSSQVASRLRCLPAITICWLTLGVTCKVHAQASVAEDGNAASADAPTVCLPDGGGYLKARLSGALQTELDWGNAGMECTGAVRPDGGLRIRFSHPDGNEGGRLVLLFGVAGLREGQSAKALPVNVTVIREGQGEFYSTQGDNKCTLDQVAQEPITGIPHRSRSYRISARGFCTGPAREVNGDGVVMLSRFDYLGRIDFGTEADPDSDSEPEDKVLAVTRP